MRLIRCLSDFKGTKNGVALAIGNFDGLHKGHQAVIERMKLEAKNNQLTSAVMIFEPQPLEFFSKDHSPARIYSIRDKLQALEVSGVELVFCMRFNKEFASMSAKQFVQELLVEKLGVKSVTVGTLFNFGKGGMYTIEDIRQIGEKFGMKAQAIDRVNLNGERVSSTLIRSYLQLGKLDLAKEALGRYYSMSGKVVRGNQIGRKLGFPTANVNMNRLVSPLRGVYAVAILLGGKLFKGMANIGYRPTVVQGQKKSILEVNIFDFNKDIYGENIVVFFIKKMRDEMKFSSINELQEKLLQDKKNTEEFLVSKNFEGF